MGGRATRRPERNGAARLSGPRGAWAEDVAARLVEGAGLRVLARNHRWRGGEIDLVARDAAGTTVFVEVKQRARDAHGSPGEFITALKARRVRRAALAYLGRDDVACRFDAILVLGTRDAHDVQWLRDAF